MRDPDLKIGENYLWRWYIIPRNRFFNIYLHKFIGSDDDRALHDHPWYSVSFLLKGKMIEFYGFLKYRYEDRLLNKCRRIKRFLPVFRSATHAHRLVVVDGPVWTLFITGPKIREWGFWCPRGWRHWAEFTSEDGNNVGKGCDD